MLFGHFSEASKSVANYLDYSAEAMAHLAVRSIWGVRCCALLHDRVTELGHTVNPVGRVDAPFHEIAEQIGCGLVVGGLSRRQREAHSRPLALVNACIFDGPSSSLTAHTMMSTAFIEIAAC